MLGHASRPDIMGMVGVQAAAASFARCVRHGSVGRAVDSTSTGRRQQPVTPDIVPPFRTATRHVRRWSASALGLYSTKDPSFKLQIFVDDSQTFGMGRRYLGALPMMQLAVTVVYIQ